MGLYGIEFLDLELPRAAERGIAHNAHSLKAALKAEFNYDFSLYRVRRLCARLEYSFTHLKQDWAVGMKSARRQRQLFIHLLLLHQALPNLQIIFSVPLTPDANPIEHWWGTAKGGLARMYSHEYDPGLILKRWRDVTMNQSMTMSGVSDAQCSLNHVLPNKRCQSYVDDGIAYAQLNLVPVSAYSECGKLGSFDLSEDPEALQTRASIMNDGTRMLYYRLWRETEGLSLVAPVGVADEEDSDADDE